MSEHNCKTKYWSLSDDEFMSLASAREDAHQNDIFLELLCRLEHKLEVIDQQRLELASLDAAYGEE